MLDFSFGIGLILIAFGVQTLVGGACLWIGMKLFGEEGRFLALMVSYIIASIIWLIPFAGGLLSLVVLVFLVRAFTSAETGTAVALVIIADVFALVAIYIVLVMLLSQAIFIF